MKEPDKGANVAMSENKRCYSNGEVTIIWDPHRCTHASRCWTGLPSVFKPAERPWIKPDGATTQRIIEQVERCPSGALSYVMGKDGPSSPEAF